MQQRYLKYVFRKRQCVRSPMFGLGQVVAEGETPLIRFLDGRECRVPANTLGFIPEEEFEAEIANRSAIEARLLIHVYGPEALDPSGRVWVRDRDGLWTTTDKLSEEPMQPPGTMPYFMPDDIGEDARVVVPHDLPDDREVIDCTVTRVPSDRE